jgi:leucyl/phenylalanyl-tRNA--protein transferase
VPIKPRATPWEFPCGEEIERRADGDLVAVGADLEPGTLLAAYRCGLFPMPLGEGPMPLGEGGGRGDLGWWSPDPRGVLPLDGLRLTRSLRRSVRDFEIRVDTSFRAVMEACADPSRDGGWIDPPFIEAYCALHELGWAHSVETWRDGVLVGGLYGVSIGGLFAGESMFHRARDASKVALVALVDLLSDGRPRLLDVQWRTEHLASLGVVELPRTAYLTRLAEALEQPLPQAFATPGDRNAGPDEAG